MKLFFSLLLLLVSLPSIAEESCHFGQEDMIVISWSGECQNGSLSGVGELIVNDIGFVPGSKIKRRIYGKFQRGIRIGLSLDLPYEQNDVPVTYQTAWFRFDDPEGNPSLIPVVVKAPDPSPIKSQDFTKYNWHPVINNKPDYSKILTFDQAFDEIKRYVKAQNSDSIDMGTFKNYLQVKNNLNFSDDPPVAGIRLTLSGKGESSAKPKKKSKQK